MPEKYKFEIIESPEDILTYIGIGVKNIFPNLHTYCSDEEWGIFESFLIREIEGFGPELLILKEEGDITGCVLIYSDNESDTLFFGFFGVLDHKLTRIEVLIEKLIETARHTGKYRFLRGPINVPTIIFGWGFSTLGSDEAPFIGCPQNPDIYQTTFLKREFYVKIQEDRIKMPGLRYDPLKDPRYDFSDYIYVNPGRAGMEQIKDEFINLHFQELNPSEIITPSSSRNFDNIVDFIFTFGPNWMMFIVYHINSSSESIKRRIQEDSKNLRGTTDSSLFKYCQEPEINKHLDIVACGYNAPNPFLKTSRGKLKSLSFHSWVVKKDFQGNGLSGLMVGESTKLAYKDRSNLYRWGSAPVNSENIKSASILTKVMGGTINRSHIVLDYELKRI